MEARRAREASAREEQERVEAIQDALLDLKEQIKLAQRGAAAQEKLVDLGSGMMFARATVATPDKMFVDVGSGVFVEMSLDEAMAAVDTRVQACEEEIARLIEQRALLQVETKVISSALAALE